MSFKFFGFLFNIVVPQEKPSSAAALVLAMLLFGSSGFAQKACNPSTNKKALKLYDQAYNTPKLSDDQRLELLKKSIDADPDCIQCVYAVARLEYQIASEVELSYQPALANFERAIEMCPDYHADAYYYAGLIYYGNQDYKEAVERFESFLLFDRAKGKTSRDHDVKQTDVAQILPEIRFFVDFYANPVPFNPVRLDAVNSDMDEYLPMLSPDNEFLFFTRKGKVKEKGDTFAREVESFMQARTKTNGLDFEAPVALPPPFNLGDNYGGVSVSLDNREMFVTVCKPVSSTYKDCDIYVTHFERKTNAQGRTEFIWSGLQNLGEAINTPQWEAQPTISADGNTLFFATIREGNIPDKEGNPTIDIYSSQRDAGGKWRKAEPLKGNINTAGNDKSPFLHSDSRTLYFSSNGRPGAGGYDIYFSKQTAEGEWSTPKNIGYPINSPKDEHGLIVSTDGSTALFASANPSGSRSLDIYAFEVPKKARPEKVVILKGDVVSGAGDPIPDARIEIKYVESNETTRVKVDQNDGHYAAVVNLREDEEVLVSVKSDTKELAFNSRVFTIADTANAVQNIDMKMEQIVPGKTYRMNDIRFATNSSRLDEASCRVLDEFAEYLNENPTLSIEIGGHTDSVGDPYKNLVLSTDRAFEVFGYLQEQGVFYNRMSFKGYGDTVPLAPNDTEAGRYKNRRTEFKILKK